MMMGVPLSEGIRWIVVSEDSVFNKLICFGVWCGETLNVLSTATGIKAN